MNQLNSKYLFLVQMHVFFSPKKNKKEEEEEEEEVEEKGISC